MQVAHSPALNWLLQASKYHTGNVMPPEISLPPVIPWIFILCFASPQLNEYFLIQSSL